MLKILYLSFVELDIPNACQAHTLGILTGFSNNKALVDAILPRPIKILPKIDNIEFYYVWPWRFSRIGRGWFKLISTIIMLLLCTKKRHHAIYVREMEGNPGPRLCSKLFHIPLYMEINDLIVPVLAENGEPPASVKKIRKNQEKDFKQSSGLIVPSIPMCNWIINQYGLCESKVHMIINGTDLTKVEKLSALEAKKKLGVSPNSLCLGFVGNIYDRYDFYTILKAIKECKKKIPELCFVIVGEGPLTSRVKTLIRSLNLKNSTIFTGYVQHNKLGQIMPALDIGLLCLTKKNSLRYGPITTKLSTYAMYRIPVISTGYSLQDYPSELEKNIYLVPPENDFALTNKIIELKENIEDRKQKAKNIYEYAIKNMSWNEIARKITDIIIDNSRSQTNRKNSNNVLNYF